MNVLSNEALLARLNRQLRPSGQRILRTDRVSRSHGHLGDFCLVDDRNCVIDQDVDLQRLKSQLNGQSQR
jgi:hypothetical protein